MRRLVQVHDHLNRLFAAWDRDAHPDRVREALAEPQLLAPGLLPLSVDGLFEELVGDAVQRRRERQPAVCLMRGNKPRNFSA